MKRTHLSRLLMILLSAGLPVGAATLPGCGDEQAKKAPASADRNRAENGGEADAPHTTTPDDRDDSSASSLDRDASSPGAGGETAHPTPPPGPPEPSHTPEPPETSSTSQPEAEASGSSDGIFTRMLRKVRGQSPRRLETAGHFQCVDCGHEFTLSEEEYADLMMKAEEDGHPFGMFALDCRNPDCAGKDKVALRMSRCPNCEKHYLSPETLDTYHLEQNVSDDVCPHCGTNIREWYREKFRRP